MIPIDKTNPNWKKWMVLLMCVGACTQIVECRRSMAMMKTQIEISNNLDALTKATDAIAASKSHK